jgi:ribose/xylose/arabinose/galactoside ABC-type transport system permease subunit
VPYRNSELGRGSYAIGSNEARPTCRASASTARSSAAYTLSGFFAGLAGLYFAIQTGSGNADPIQAGTYTLNSIAAVVIGGTSLFGGVGRCHRHDLRRDGAALDHLLLPASSTPIPWSVSSPTRCSSRCSRD